MTVVRDGRATARVPVSLSASSAYIAPSGRWCRWWPGASIWRAEGDAVFLYHGADGRPAPRMAGSDGFYLSQANLHLLTRVG